ncbi:hypothetical protein [Pseudomonas sp. NA-150]|uniref:hypothetical protein n=1 Tax=Pseudomonas sp. NA-150 TaxID=3367525 RepID=UPI0037CA9685
MSRNVLAAVLLSLAPAACASAATKCQEQKVEGHTAQMCLFPGDPFQHDIYRLSVDGQQIFSLTDDFAEDINLMHHLPVGPAVEYPLSNQGGASVAIKGGCVPISQNNAEVARVCNFQWGKYQVIKDVRFEFLTH